MSSNSSQKGKRFEDRVADLLEALCAQHPGSVRVTKQPRISLNDGQEVCPDFELQFRLPFEVGRYLLECQDRKRSKPDIAHKIRYVKALSKKNRFIFVHRSRLPETTRRALGADGVLVMDLNQLTTFLKQMGVTLSAINRIKPEPIFFPLVSELI